MSWERRLRELEEKRAKASSPHRDELGSPTRQFVSGVLSAMSNIRREEIDRGERFGYTPSALREMHSEGLAQHLAALAMLERGDESYAQALLSERGEDELIRRAYQVSDRFGNKDDAA